MLLKNKNAVVTGCNRGIGKEILETFSSNGANIFACVRNSDNNFINFTKELEKKFNNKIFIIDLDLSDTENIKNAANEILSKEKSIDILINNAGIIHTALFQMTSEVKLKEIFDINFFSQTVFTQYILKSMIRKKTGSILYISSSSAIDSNKGRSAYSSAKAALITQAKTLSKEVGPYNIRVNIIAPGLTDTDMMNQNTDKKTIEQVTSEISLKRIGLPNEIAKAALFLSSDYSSYITGQVLRVDEVCKLEIDNLDDLKKLSKKMRKKILEMALYAGASSSHFGGALSSVDILATLFGKIMNFSKDNLKNPERDRFILSKGHGCLVYYSILNILNIISDDELKTFEKDDSKLLGHPVKSQNIGIDFSTGVLAWDSLSNWCRNRFKKKN